MIEDQTKNRPSKIAKKKKWPEYQIHIKGNSKDNPRFQIAP